MDLISLLLTIAVVGAIVWLICQAPIAAPFKNIIIGVAVFFVILIVLKAFGIMPDLRLNLK